MMTLGPNPCPTIETSAPPTYTIQQVTSVNSGQPNRPDQDWNPAVRDLVPIRDFGLVVLFSLRVGEVVASVPASPRKQYVLT
jgi:hypothetical protein